MFTDRRENSLESRRIKQHWPKDRDFKILSLDGGGIRGYFEAQILKHIKENLMADHETIGDFFDLIAGTSTGGLIALCIGHSIDLNQVNSFYETEGKNIFSPPPLGKLGKIGRCIKHFRKPAFDSKTLEDVIKSILGDRSLGDATNRLVIPACLMPKSEIAVFKTDHHPDYKNDWRSESWKIARATSAAPTYLQGLDDKDSGKIFVDGGIWANNPVMTAVVDALTAYDISVDQIKILSLGTGNPPFQLKLNAVSGGLFHWREIIKASMFLTTDNATAQAKLLLGPSSVIRIEPSEPAANIELDDYSAAMKLTPDEALLSFNNHIPSLAPFFQHKVASRERHYSKNPKF